MNDQADTPKPDEAPAVAEAPKVTWDDSTMATSYANVVNVISSREELTLFFGTNQTWNVRKDDELVVSLTNRIMLNPHAAKRLFTLLAAVLAEYEKRHGKVNIDPRSSGTEK